MLLSILVGVFGAFIAVILVLPGSPEIGGWVSFAVLIPLIATPIWFGVVPGILVAIFLVSLIPWLQTALGYENDLPTYLSSMLAVVSVIIPVVTGLTAHAFRTLDRALKHERMIQKEAHHRIKNSLSLVATLLDIARYEEAQQTSTSVLEKAVGHVASIATVHDSLSRSNTFETIDLHDHLMRLGRNLEISGYSGDLIQVHGPAVTVSGNKGVAIGLVLNELITNARKHGGPDAEVTRVNIIHTDTAADLCLQIVQPNAQLPAEFSVETGGNGMGLEIVKNVLSEYNGSIRISSRNPAEYRVCLDR